MSTALIAACIAGYLVIGIAVTVQVGRSAWKDPDIHAALKKEPYEEVRKSVHSEQMWGGLFWPLTFVMSFFGLLVERFSGDPHINHQVELDQQVERYESLVQLQRNLGHDIEDEMPLAWCVCQKSPKQEKSEQHWMDRQIQHRVELLHQKVSQAQRGDWTDMAALLRMITRDVKRHATDIEDYLRKQSRWE